MTEASPLRVLAHIVSDVPILEKTVRKYSKLLTCIMISGVLASFPAYADTQDIISDAPFELSTDSASASGSTAAPESKPVPATAAASTAAAASSSVSSGAAASSGSPVIVDTPDASGSTNSGYSAPAPSGSVSVTPAQTETSASVQTETQAESQTAVMPGTTTASTESSLLVTPGSTAAGSSDSTAVSTSGSAAGPGTGSSASSSTGSLIGPGTGSAVTSTSVASSSAVGTPGADYSSVPKTRVELGFTVISPNFSYNGSKVAEGSVRLADGSWESIGHDQYIRQPYFRMIREDGDWYVVAVHASKIGSHYISDGSVVDELWLKKSDCTAQSYIDLNTSNSQRHQIVINAMSLLGKGYRYAGNGPDAFDCSGLVKNVMSSVGISVSRTSSEICNEGTQVGVTGLRPGDIVGRSGHVGIYIGDGLFVHAAETSTGVVTESLEAYNSSSRFSHYVNVVGD